MGFVLLLLLALIIAVRPRTRSDDDRYSAPFGSEDSMP